MDVKNPIQLDRDGQITSAHLQKPVIRTMKKDIAALKKGGLVQQPQVVADPEKSPEAMVRKASPPDGLPVVEPIEKPGQSFDMMKEISPAETEEKAKKETEIKQKIEEAKISQRRVEEMRIQRTEEKKTELAKPIKKSIEPEKIKTEEQKIDWKFVVVGLAVVLIVGGIGGFFYWKYYIKEPSLPVTHLECQDYQCLEIEGEGEGESNCSINEDCLPPEPTLPIPLISIEADEIIEIDKGQESSIPGGLKSLSIREQEKDTFKRILFKSVNGLEKEYFDLDKLVSSLGLDLPTGVNQLIAEDNVKGENYILFFYSQEQGNRLGLVIDLKDGIDLTSELKNWEKDMVNDLEPLLLAAELPNPATPEFQDNLYQEKSIRYLNFPSPDLSIDYAVVGNKLIIATSRESMFKIIDNLLTITDAQNSY